MRGTRVTEKRRRAYELFDQGKTIGDVERLAHVSRRTSYLYFSDWRKKRAEEKNKKERIRCWSSCVIFCKCSCSFWRN